MSASEDDLHRAVDEVLEPVWPQERRRAVVLSAGRTLARIAGFMLALLVPALIVHFAFGLVIPWSFFGFIALLTTGIAMHGVRTDSHLGRE